MTDPGPPASPARVPDPGTDDPPAPGTVSPRPDLRAAALGLVAWLAALVALRLPRVALVVGLSLGLVVVVVLLRRATGSPTDAARAVARTAAAWLLLATVVVGVTVLRVERVQRSGVADLVERGGTVTLTVRTRSDPRVHERGGRSFVTLRGVLTEVRSRDGPRRVRAPVLVIGDPTWSRVPLGARVQARGRFDAADDPDLAAVVLTRGPPSTTTAPTPALRAVDRVRQGIRTAVAPHADRPAALVPALVDGDDAEVDDALDADFRASGLTHLLAVSGTNLTIIVGALLILARWLGVRARGLLLVGVLGVVGFVLLTRTEPSVVRAAAMGSVGLLAMGTGGRRQGTRALGVAVCALMLLDPWLAVSVGFALSVCATAGILLLAPGWRDALRRWLPRWAAEAVAVPLAAQLACTPLVAAISDQVSLVAVAANLVVAPVVGPVTVLGLLAGVVAVAWPPLGQLLAAPAVAGAAWIVAVAERSAGLPAAAVGWQGAGASLVLLVVLCCVLALTLERVLARRGTSLGCVLVAGLLVGVPLPTPGWPAPGWVLVACDVGQGDALVLNAGDGRALVVDAGPDEALVDGCLRRLGVERVPLVVLTHFHADHVDGLPGVLDGRAVQEVLVSPLDAPEGAARRVDEQVQAAGGRTRVAEVGQHGTLGQLRWRVLAPADGQTTGSTTSAVLAESAANDASVVLLVEVRGVRVLLLGDQELEAQGALRRAVPDLQVDVVKVAHHGSRTQDSRLAERLGARLAVISCGRDNDYGHPSPATVRLLEDTGARVARTDTMGDVAVAVDGEGDLRMASRGPPTGARAGR